MYYAHAEKWYEGGGTPPVPGDGTGASPKRGKREAEGKRIPTTGNPPRTILMGGRAEGD